MSTGHCVPPPVLDGCRSGFGGLGVTVAQSSSQVRQQAATSSAPMVLTLPAPSLKMAGAKAPKKTRAPKSGMTSCVGGSQGGVGAVDGIQAPKEDSFLVRLPGGEEYVIPGRYVRYADDATREILQSYASLLNVQTEDLVLWGEDLSDMFAEINYGLSIFGFHDRVLADAKDFVMPEEIRTRDAAVYVEQGCSLESLVRSRRAGRASDRFNLARCSAVFRDCPEYERVASIARDGVILDVPPDLVLQSVPEPPRALQVKLQPVYSKHAYKVWSKMNAVVVPIADLSPTDAARVHFNNVHLTRKPVSYRPSTVPGEPDIAEGGSRFLMDCSNSDSDQVLNTPEVKEMVINRYGFCSLPTFQSIVVGWYRYAEREGVSLGECRMFKDDVEGAFAQLDISPESVCYLAIAIGAGLVLLYIAGLFGWLGFPMAFGVLSRALEWVLQRDLNIPVRLYVDDIIGFSRAERAEGDQLYIEAKCEEVMGSHAVNYEKKVPPCVSGEVLGWAVRLQQETFRPSDKGVRKLAFAFWIVASGQSFPLVVYQMLASLSDHYSLGVPGMKPFSQALHGMSIQFGSGAKNKYYRKVPSSAARMSIEVWRVASLLLLRKNKVMCRSLRYLLPSMLAQGPVVITDGSPWGSGLGLYTPSGELIRYMAYKFPFPESPFQNAREYLGYLLAFLFLQWVLRDSPVCCEVTWIGDNEAALAWASQNKCNSSAAQYAFLAVTWLQMSSKFSFSRIQHQPGFLMGDIDNLSRGLPHSLDVSKEYVLSEGQLHQLDNLFSLLDPGIARDNIDDHHVAFSSVVNMTRDLFHFTA